MLHHAVTGHGPLAVLVHGITESSASWDPLLAGLSGTHRVLTVDLRGHGRSPAEPPYDIRTLAEDVHETVQQVAAGEPPLLVGHSLGGIVVTAYAAAHPARAVLNVDQPLQLTMLQGAVVQLAPALRSPAFPEVMAAVFAELYGRLPAAEVARLGGLRRPDQDVVLGVWELLIDSSPEELAAAVDTVIGGVDAPYLALHGTDPGPDYPGWLAERIPGTTVEVWDGDGHYPHLVQPQRFLQRVRAFDPA